MRKRNRTVFFFFFFPLASLLNPILYSFSICVSISPLANFHYRANRACTMYVYFWYWFHFCLCHVFYVCVTIDTLSLSTFLFRVMSYFIPWAKQIPSMARFCFTWTIKVTRILVPFGAFVSLSLSLSSIEENKKCRHKHKDEETHILQLVSQFEYQFGHKGFLLN